jgi:hypothetical protein
LNPPHPSPYETTPAANQYGGVASVFCNINGPPDDENCKTLEKDKNSSTYLNPLGWKKQFVKLET